MKRFMGKRLILPILVLPFIIVLGYAWLDGGREPVREIELYLPIPREQK